MKIRIFAIGEIEVDLGNYPDEVKTLDDIVKFEQQCIDDGDVGLEDHLDCFTSVKVEACD